MRLGAADRPDRDVVVQEVASPNSKSLMDTIFSKVSAPTEIRVIGAGLDELNGTYVLADGSREGVLRRF